MKSWLFALLFFVFSMSVVAEDERKFDLKQFAQVYFSTMVSTQAPNATEKELEAYLALLTDDVGHAHLPYVTDDSRSPDGKQAMRNGMTFYLGAHTEYQAELLDVFIFNDSAVAIRYKDSAKGFHPQLKKAFSFTQTMMELLEIENGKVAVIRKYHE